MKLYVICLMASSVDGRVHHSRWRPKGAGSEWFERIHEELGGDAWLIGRVTGSEFAKGKPYPTSTNALGGGVLLLRYLLQNDPDAAGQ